MHINVCWHQSSYLAGKRINILLYHLDSNFTQKKNPYYLPHTLYHSSWAHPDAGLCHLPLNNGKHWLKGPIASTWPLVNSPSLPSSKRIVWEIIKIYKFPPGETDFSGNRFGISGSDLTNSVSHGGARSVVWWECGGSTRVRRFQGSCPISLMAWMTLSLEMMT